MFLIDIVSLFLLCLLSTHFTDQGQKLVALKNRKFFCNNCEAIRNNHTQTGNEKSNSTNIKLGFVD